MTYINIFFTVNNNYIPYLATAIASIIANINDNSFARFYIISNDIVDINKKKIDKLKNIKDFNIEYIKIDNSRFENIVKSSQAHITNETNYRFIISSLKPELDKCLFLDADLIADKDITELYNINIDDFYMGAVADQLPLTENCWAKRLDLAKNYRYVNTGVILVNLKKWREENIENKLFENVIKYANLLQFPDQDTLNITLQDKVKNISHIYNAMPVQNYLVEKEKKEAFNNPVIIHWAGYRKPWVYSDANYSEYFWKYAHMTPFYEDIIYINVLEQVDKKINTIIESLINEKNTLQLKLNEINTKIIDLQYEHYKLIRSKIKYNNNWIKLFGIYNTKDYLIFYLFGFKITLKMNEKNINKLAWWIPIRKWRDNFRSKFFDNFIGGVIMNRIIFYDKLDFYLFK